LDVYYIDGEFVPADAAVIPVNDLAVLRGYGVFDLMRTYNGEPLFMEDHIGRLANSASEIGLHFPWQTAEVSDIIRRTLQQNPHLADASIRVVVTGGPVKTLRHRKTNRACWFWSRPCPACLRPGTRTGLKSSPW
jgi:branched-chain amino acid aminotransferase